MPLGCHSAMRHYMNPLKRQIARYDFHLSITADADIFFHMPLRH
jgi:hypothetical protein